MLTIFSWDNSGVAMLLSDLKSGGAWMIKSVNAGVRLFNRLASMGICDGTEINLIKNNASGPVIIEVNGSKFAIGRSMAEKIVIGKVDL